MRQARDDDRFVGLDAIPDAERKRVDRRTAMLARAFDDLILERVLADAGQGRADLLDEAVAETRLVRFVVVLCRRYVRFCERGEPDGPVQGAG